MNRLPAILTLLTWVGSNLTAQGALILQRIHDPITLDGYSHEQAWQAVEPLPLTTILPIHGGSPTERTEIRIAYDDEYIYASGRFYDSDPDGIRGNVLIRDGLMDNPSEDKFALILDTFNDNENALAFFTSSGGSRADAAIYQDAEFSGRGRPWNESWNTFWDVAVVRTEEGWFAEMRIPFSSLRFQDQEGHVVMGVITWRKIGRKNEYHSWPSIPPKWTFGRLKPSIAQDVELSGVHSEKPFYITPYLLSGNSQVSELNADTSGYVINGRDPIRDLGLDLKYSLTSNLTLDLTVNTDFAQVEADEERVNLTRFNLFFPEKRLFFQERASVFDFSTGGETRLFYTRRVGLSEFGQVPILGGARLVGRIGDWDLGVLDMQTARATFVTEDDSTLTIPSENFGVVRLRRQVLNENSYTGGMFTSRRDADGNFVYAYGLDGVFRLHGDDYITYMWAQTFENGWRDQFQQPIVSSGRVRTTWERRTDRGLGYSLDFVWIGPDYRPGSGFTKRSDIARIRSRMSYGLYPGAGSRIYRHGPGINAAIFWRNADGLVESGEISGEWRFSTRTGAWGRLNAKYIYENLDEDFDISDDIFVPHGNYRFAELSAFMSTPRSGLFQSRLNFNGGSYYDGSRLTVGLSPSWVVSRFLELGGEYQVNRVAFPERQQSLKAQIARLRLKLTLTTAVSLAAFLQYSSARDAVIVNTRIRYNPREGTDLYLVYDEGLNTDRYNSTPPLPRSNSRTLLLKYSRTFLYRQIH